MKAKINKNGWLEIERAGKFISQSCLYDKGSYCGDYCPAFEEDTLFDNSKTLILHCCGTYLIRVEDLRVNK